MSLSNREFKSIYDKYSHLLYYIVNKFNVPPQEGDEIVQEAFLRLFKNPQVPKEKIKSFLVTTTRNLVYDRAKRAETRLVTKNIDDLDDSQPDIKDNEKKCNDTQLSVVSSVVEELSQAKGGEFFGLFYNDGLSINEIAEKSGCTSSKVKVSIHRFRKKFKDKIKYLLETKDIEDYY